MSAVAVTTSYHLPVVVRNYIDQEAKNLNLKKGVFLSFLIEDYEKTKSENEQLKAYFELATAPELQAAQTQEAELDWQTESAYQTDNE